MRIPMENYARQLAGERTEVPLTGDERATLVAALDRQRETFALKCAGLDAGQLSERAVPPSRLSLHGIARHLAGVERWWFQIQFAGDDVPMLYYTDEDPDQDFDSLDGDPAQALAIWAAECDRSRAIVAATADLDRTGTLLMTGQAFSLRRLLGNMAAEYARHNGHADLLRERLDGSTGH